LRHCIFNVCVAVSKVWSILQDTLLDIMFHRKIRRSKAKWR